MSHSSGSKRLKKEVSYCNDDFTPASKVYIIKLVPDRSGEHQSQLEKSATSTSDSVEDSIDKEVEPHSLSNQNVLYDENVDDTSSYKSSLSEEMEDIDSDYDFDYDTEAKHRLLIDEESVSVDYDAEVEHRLLTDEECESEFPSELSVNVSQLNDCEEGDLQPSLQTSEDLKNLLNAVSENTDKNTNKNAKPDNNTTKRLKGWNASRGKVKFQPKWLKEFPFIEYDAKDNVMHCKVCRKYVNDWRKTSPFVIGNRNFRESMLRYHERSSMHTECQELADAVATESGGDAVDKDLYKEQLSHVFKSVYFIFKNKMPYTHYPQLCESQKREGTDFSVYTSHLKVVPLFGKFICMAFEKEVAKKLENVTEFSLVIDASFRRNIESHDLIYLKYLDNFMVRTVFLGVIDSSAKLHDSIYSILCDLFKKYGVASWIDKVVYIMTDKSDSHLWLEGLIDLIKDMSPQNFFTSVRFLSHKIKYCASVVQNHKVSSTFDALLWSIYCYYEKVDKGKKNLMYMNKELDSIVECYGNLPKNSYTTLYYEALKAIEEDYGNMVQLLESEQLMFHYDVKVRKAGARILSIITRSCFLCKLALFIDIFSCLNDFAIKLSSEDILPYDVHILLDEVCADIEKAADAEGPKCVEIGEELAATPCCFRGVEIVEDGSIHHVIPEIKKFSQDVISYLKSILDDDSLLEKCFIFNVCMWPEDEEIVSFGDNEFAEIFQKFSGDVKPLNIENALTEWRMFKRKVLSLFPYEVRQNSKSVILKMVSEYEEEFPCVALLLKKILLLNFDSSEIQRGYHEMCLNKSFSRSMLSLQSLQTSMMISMYGPSLSEFDFSLALDLFLNSRHRKFRKKIIDKKLLYF